MPTVTPVIKINATQSYGAKVVLHGEVYDAAYKHALSLATNMDMTLYILLMILMSFMVKAPSV